MDYCKHENIECLNHYEIIRKYLCTTCGEVMMCACEKEFAIKHFPHQLNEGTDLLTKNTHKVTKGFQEKVCNSCKGLPEEPHPKDEIYGATSKIKRYYWREIIFEKMNRMEEWAKRNGFLNAGEAQKENPELNNKIEKESLDFIKEFHSKSPKYIYKEESQKEIVEKFDVEVLKLEGEYVKTTDKKTKIKLEGKLYSAEDYAIKHFNGLGYEVILVESVPFHVLFGVFMHNLIQDELDEFVLMMGFERPISLDNSGEKEEIRTRKPQDFGSPGYGERRKLEINSHLKAIFEGNNLDLNVLFSDWLEPSDPFRKYLWAYQDSEIIKARKILEIIPPQKIRLILENLVKNYWGRYLGWPDLLVFNNNEFFFVEVKSSNDRLSLDQKSWIKNNHENLKLPFKLLKIHKT